MEKYTIEELRSFLHYLIDRIMDKGVLYRVWVTLERAMLH